MLTDEQLIIFIKTHFVYDSETGIVKWKQKPKFGLKTNNGVVGSKYKSGNNFYLIMKCKGRGVGVHRIAWCLYYGEWPTKSIDHIDGNGLNNRIDNLRHVSHRENHLNRKSHRNGKLGGSYLDKKSAKWHARIRINGKTKSIGLFNTEKEAHERYLQARKEIEP